MVSTRCRRVWTAAALSPPCSTLALVRAYVLTTWPCAFLLELADTGAEVVLWSEGWPSASAAVAAGRWRTRASQRTGPAGPPSVRRWTRSGGAGLPLSRRPRPKGAHTAPLSDAEKRDAAPAGLLHVTAVLGSEHCFQGPTPGSGRREACQPAPAPARQPARRGHEREHARGFRERGRAGGGGAGADRASCAPPALTLSPGSASRSSLGRGRGGGRGDSGLDRALHIVKGA